MFRTNFPKSIGENSLPNMAKSKAKPSSSTSCMYGMSGQSSMMGKMPKKMPDKGMKKKMKGKMGY